MTFAEELARCLDRGLDLQHKRISRVLGKAQKVEMEAMVWWKRTHGTGGPNMDLWGGTRNEYLTSEEYL